MAQFFQELWFVTAEMAPYLLLGFIVAGLLYVWLPEGFVARHLGGKGILPVFKASVLGIPLPLCSCGVIPVAAGLRRQGASKGATVSFLLSTPQTGVDSLLVTFAMLGPVYAIYRPVAALFAGMFGGLLTNATAESEDWSKVDQAEEAAPQRGGGVIGGLKTAFLYGFATLPMGIGKPLLVGLLIAAVISFFVPDNFFADSVGGGPLAYLVMLGIGIPLYVCSTGSVPIAASLIMAGVSPGAALVFLVSGPATNAAAITTVWNVLGKKTAFVYLGTVVLTAIVSGVILDLLFSNVGTASMEAHLHQSGPGWFANTCGVILLIVLGYAVIPRSPKKLEIPQGDSTMEIAELTIGGMT